MDMQFVDLPILGGFNTARITQFDCERTVNMYDVIDPRGKKPGYLREFNGIQSVVTSLLGTHGRKFYVFNTDLFVVVGANVYLLDTSLNPTLIGTLSTSTGFVDIEANQRTPYPHIIFVDGVDGWIWDGSTFTQITDVDFPGQPVDVTYQDGFFFVASGESNYVGISNLNDGFAWQSANRIALQTNPDATMVGTSSANRRIYLFGDSCIEMWYPKGGVSPPYARDNTFAPDVGAAATSSICKTSIEQKGQPVQTCIFFLSVNKEGSFVVMKLIGATLMKISTEALEEIFNSYAHQSEARGYLYQEGGHLFYQISFTQDNHTWVWDDSTQTWFEKEMLNGSRYIAEDHVFFNGNQYLLGYNNGRIYELNGDYVDNDGEAIRKLRRMPIISDQAHRRVKIDRIEIDAQRGVGTANPPSDEPTVRLRISKDAGTTYGNTLTQPLAPIGEYSQLTIFRNPCGFGRARDLVIEFETTSKVHFNVFSAIAYWGVLPR